MLDQIEEARIALKKSQQITQDPVIRKRIMDYVLEHERVGDILLPTRLAEIDSVFAEPIRNISWYGFSPHISYDYPLISFEMSFAGLAYLCPDHEMEQLNVGKFDKFMSWFISADDNFKSTALQCFYTIDEVVTAMQGLNIQPELARILKIYNMMK